MKKKRIFSLFLAFAVTMSAAGCQGKTQSRESTELTQSTETTHAAETAGKPEEESGQVAGGTGTGDGQEQEGYPWMNSIIAGAVTEDTGAELKDDFYLAVNRDYLKNTQIREGRTGESSFDEVQDVLDKRLLDMMTDETIEGHDAEMIRELYTMFLDWDERNRLGMSPVMPHIEAISRLENLDELTEYQLSEEGLYYGASLSGFGLMADLEDSRWYCLDIISTELTLNDSAEYEKMTSLGERLMNAHEEKTRLLFDKAGYSEEEIDRLLKEEYAFEKELSSAIMSVEETMSPDALEKLLNPVTMEELAQMSPNYPLTGILGAAGLGDSQRINLDEPEWLEKLNELYTEEHFQEIKSYILVKTMDMYAEDLDEELYRKVQEIDNGIWGIEGSLPDEQEAADVVNSLLLTSVSKVYAQRYIGQETREDVTGIVKECIDRYRTMLLSENWLTEETRQKAVEKLDNLALHVAYPDQWEDTEKLKLTRREDGGSYFMAVNEEINQYQLDRMRARINTEINKEQWADDMAITEVNAYYNPQDNSINIIGGILGGAFYDPEMTEEEKLAGIGVVIGHEISHAFDPTGAQFDKDGNFASWWTEEDYEAFGVRTQKLVDYYDTIIPFADGERYTGSNVQGEATADLAGVKCMLLIAKEQNDFDYDRFFRSYAALWKEVMTREYAEMVVYQDSHPLPYLRVNVVVMQCPEFYETYGIEEGDGMYMAEEDRIPVW